MTTTTVIPPSTRFVINGRLIVGAAFVSAVLLISISLATYVEKSGNRFVDEGKSVLSTLRSLAQDLREKNTDGIGKLYAAHYHGTPRRDVVLGDGYGPENSLRQYFGLKDAAEVDELTVKRPRSGIVQRFQHVAADRIVEITEGRDALVEKHYKPVRQ